MYCVVCARAQSIQRLEVVRKLGRVLAVVERNEPRHRRVQGAAQRGNRQEAEVRENESGRLETGARLRRLAFKLNAVAVLLVYLVTQLLCKIVAVQVTNHSSINISLI